MSNPKKGPKKKDERRTMGILNEPNIGAHYNTDELDFLKAIDKFKSKYKRTPNWIEVHQILIELGWRKVKEPTMKVRD